MGRCDLLPNVGDDASEEAIEDRGVLRPAEAAKSLGEISVAAEEGVSRSVAGGLESARESPD